MTKKKYSLKKEKNLQEELKLLEEGQFLELDTGEIVFGQQQEE